MQMISMMEDLPIEKQYDLLIADMDNLNALQDNPLCLPTGFYEVKTRRGEDAGYGFYCPKCKINYPAHAPTQIKHCNNTISEPPKGILGFRKKLETVKLPY